MEKIVNKKKLKVSILSLSLLTVMAGAAMAPALGVISEYFSDEKTLFVQMIISMPAVFIFLTSFVFPKLAAKFRARTLLMIGLAFYTIGGCVAGVFNSIWIVLLMRALVGVGVGIIMPLSTGLLAFYFSPQEQEGLMGWSSAMNNMGGVIATLISGALATVSWRISFLVYLMGLISIVLCAAFMPNDKIQSDEADERRGSAEPEHVIPSTGQVFRSNYVYIIAMFLEMSTFFIYPANFAMVTVRAGVIPENLTAIIMAIMDLVAFFGGMLFVEVKAAAGGSTKFVAPILFVVGYIPSRSHRWMVRCACRLSMCRLRKRRRNTADNIRSIKKDGTPRGDDSNAAYIRSALHSPVRLTVHNVRCHSYCGRCCKLSVLLGHSACSSIPALVGSDTECSEIKTKIYG